MDAKKITCPHCQAEFGLDQAVFAEAIKADREKQKQSNQEELNAIRRQASEELEKQRKQDQGRLEEAEKARDEAQRKAVEVEKLVAKAQAERVETAKKEEAFARAKTDWEADQHRWKADQVQALAKEERSKATEFARLQMEKERAEAGARLKAAEDEKIGMLKKIDELQRRGNSKENIRVGEGQEQEIQEKLQQRFKMDEISEVARGKNGADVLQVVVHEMQRAGAILFESKFTDQFAQKYVDKLRDDRQSTGADVGVLVTRTFPSAAGEASYFFVDDRLIVVRPHLFLFIADMLRQQLIKVEARNKVSMSKPENAQRVFDYVASEDFKAAIKEAVELFRGLNERNEQDYRVAIQSFTEKRELLQRLSHTMLASNLTAYAAAGLNPPGELNALHAGGQDLRHIPLPETKIKKKPGRKKNQLEIDDSQ